jgi:eukaryotic-like serine/threonine-protein kinase
MNYGRYEVDGEQSQVGKGAMGIVYRALDPRLGRQVAIKVLHKKLLYDDEAVQSFLKEATLNASLSHPNILTILDIGEERGEVYIAMEFLDGMPLSKMAKSLSKNDIISIGMQIADGLDSAHKRGVVHRDIKPANIMVKSDGQIKITDFGIAKGIGGSDDILQTQTGVIKGTPAYMSPEQARGDSKNVDGRSDLFSLGVILYELSVGKRPFGGDGKDFIAVFGEIQSKTPLEPCKANASVDRELSSIIMKALQKDPARRYQSGSEMVEALTVCQKQGAPPTTKKKSPVLTGGLCAAVLAVVAVGGAFLFHGGKKSHTETAPAAQSMAQRAIPAAPANAPAKAPTTGPVTAPVTAPATAPVTAPGTAPVPAPGTAPVPAPTNAPANGLHAPTAMSPAARPSAPAKAVPAVPVQPASTEAPKHVKHEAKAAKPAGKRISAGESGAAKKASAAKEANAAKAGTVRETKREEREKPAETATVKPDVGTGASVAASTQFAFLKVATTPAGSQVYVNGALKGMTPLKLRLGLGNYKVRLAHSGYRDVSTSVSLDKMAEFPINEELKPE